MARGPEPTGLEAELKAAISLYRDQLEQLQLAVAEDPDNMEIVEVWARNGRPLGVNGLHTACMDLVQGANPYPEGHPMHCITCTAWHVPHAMRMAWPPRFACRVQPCHPGQKTHFPNGPLGPSLW